MELYVDAKAELEIVWEALTEYRDRCIPEGEASNDTEWGDICLSMARLEEVLD